MGAAVVLPCACGTIDGSGARFSASSRVRIDSSSVRCMATRSVYLLAIREPIDKFRSIAIGREGNSNCILPLAINQPLEQALRCKLVRHWVAAREVGIAMNSRPQIRQADATRAALFAWAVTHHFQADREHLLHARKTSLAITQAARIAIVKNHR